MDILNTAMDHCLLQDISVGGQYDMDILNTAMDHCLLQDIYVGGQYDMDILNIAKDHSVYCRIYLWVVSVPATDMHRSVQYSRQEIRPIASVKHTDMIKNNQC